MNIAIIHHRIGLKGGLETRLFNYIEYFLSKGHKITVFTNRVEKGINIPKEVKIKNAHLKYFPKPYRIYAFDIALGLILNRKKFDFILSFGRTSHQDAVLAPANHLGYIRAIGKTKLNMNDKIQILLDRLAFEKSKIIFASSEMMKNELVELFKVLENKIVVLNPPVNTNKFNRSLENRKKEFRLKYKMSEGKKSFVFVSTGHQRKGFDLLYKIFKEIENEPYELVVAGNRIPYETVNLKYAGFVENTEELYTAADFTIHPAKYEPFGQIITESLQCGTPVLISDMVGAKEKITENEGIVVKGFEIEKWIEAIHKISSKKYKIDENWAYNNGLTIERHLEKMINSCNFLNK